MSLGTDNRGLEFADSLKPLKTSSNISYVLSRFTEGSKLRSIGVFSAAENTDPRIVSNSGNVLGDESCIDAMKMRMHSMQKNGDMEISKLFDTLLALKLAYVKLQRAHIPYDPVKIRAADQEVVSLLDTLCKIKNAYKSRLLKEADSISACSALLIAEIKVKERSLEKLKSQARSKHKKVASLRRALRELETRNKKLEDDIREREIECFHGLNLYSFENIVKAAGRAIHDFTKPLIAFMKLLDWDLDEAADTIQTSVAYVKRSHKKYAFEAYVARIMFQGFSISPQTCFLEKIMNLDDPIVALMEDPQSSFAEFCRTKYLLVVHPMMEVSFFGNLDHRNLVANGIHPRTPFFCAFVRMAQCVWALQGFSAFIEPKAEMFGVKQGSEFSDVYMEVLEELKEYKSMLDAERERCKVEFMIMPGFKVGETIVRSQVYVSGGVFLDDEHAMQYF